MLDGALRYWPDAFTAEEASRYLAALRHGLAWQSEEVIIFGEARRVPRLIAWYGEPEAIYTYSGVRHVPQPFNADLQAIRARIQSLSGAKFNSALANLYRDGRDGMGWHADNEPELGRNPVIASVSFGVTRRFTLRHRWRKALKHAVDLEGGSLLVMEGPTQHHWLHALPKTVRPLGERLNLTYRYVKKGTDLFS
ncbi:MAG TPA: alpha-ketoglutarate-dependent dioxygenase AlkB [Steroidobacteraceae bacterium]|nr:alpha-ketoglutarate-dependent dioxygenase AlkB [Steroidobacteraceae bacterium]